MTHVLVCGGAGYIGSHVAKLLVEEGFTVTVFDNLSTGHRAAVRWGDLVEGDLLDRASLRTLFAKRRIDAVMHFGAFSVVSESMRDPYAYYKNNVGGTLTLLEEMREAAVDRIVFSSTAAVYGIPSMTPIEESHTLAPINPYGASKMMVERLLDDAAHAYGLRSVSLRYFNAAGADPSGELGESHSPETHLVPNVLKAALSGSSVNIFGDDYATRDGTCVRDYVHVNDLARAHLLALRYLDAQAGAHVFNLGGGEGSSVMEIIDAANRVTGRQVKCERMPRRVGDPPALVANSQLAQRVLGWQPVFNDIAKIVETAWRWHTQARY